MQYETFGHPLGNSLYCNTGYSNRAKGYVTSVNLRLFTEWKDDRPLYLFTIPMATSDAYRIRYRYAIQPQRNTTEWQTIKISSRGLPIFFLDFLAIGMQDSSNTAQIYTIKSPLMVSAANITENTTNFMLKPDLGIGVAFGYTVVHDDKEIF